MRFKFLDYVSPKPMTEAEKELLRAHGIYVPKGKQVAVVSLITQSAFGEICCLHWKNGTESVMHADNLELVA